MTIIRRWWWPLYVFLFPLLWSPNAAHDFIGNYRIRVLATVFFIAGGFLLEWAQHPTSRLTRPRVMLNGLLREPPMLLALGLGAWAIVTAPFAPQPVVALTGSIANGSDGAFWQLALGLVFCLVYLQVKRDPGTVARLASAVVSAGAVLAGMGLLEVILNRSLLMSAANPSSLPLGTFPGRGHLAGFLALAGAVAAGLWMSAAPSALPALGLISAGIGASVNRSSLVALAIGVVSLALPRRARLGVAVAVAAIGYSIGAWAVTDRSAGERVDLGDTYTATTRSYFWRAAMRGILDRPIAGWGGGQFQNEWYRFLSREELETFLKLEWGVKELREVVGSSDTDPVFLVRDAADKTGFVSIGLWKAHNQLLEVGLMRGLVGLALYVGLVAFSLWGASLLAPGLLAYQAFLVLWFMPFHVEGLVYALMGAAAAANLAGIRARRQQPAASENQRVARLPGAVA